MTESSKPKELPSQEKTQTIIINPEQLYGINNHDDEIELRELWNTLWAGKWIIIATTALFAITTVVVSLNMPNIYKSTATLIPTTAEEQSGAAALAARFGGLASMAGVSMGRSSVDKTAIAIETLKSREFLARFIQKHNLKASLLAVKAWDAVNNKLIYNTEIYNEQTNTWNWKSQSNWKKDTTPSDQEAVKALLGNFSVSMDAKSNIVTINASHLSPFIAQQWVQWLISDINQHMREQDIADANKSIHYLNKKLEETSIAEMQQIFYELIEAQTKTKMLAEIRDQYVLRVIDPATVPERKDKPKRALIFILSALVGIFFGAILTLTKSLATKT